MALFRKRKPLPELTVDPFEVARHVHVLDTEPGGGGWTLEGEAEKVEESQAGLTANVSMVRGRPLDVAPDPNGLSVVRAPARKPLPED